MVWLTSQSLWALVVGFLALAGVIAVACRFAARGLVAISEREGATAIAAPLMPALGAAFAILVAITLANEADYLSSAQGIVSNEAADASRLAWASTTPGLEEAAIQAALQRYLAATRANEWHGSGAATGNDPATVSAFAKLEQAVRTQAARPDVGTPVSTELLAALDALTTDRRNRLAAAARELPALYVITLAVSALALIANAVVLTIRFTWRSALLVSGLVIVIGLSMALLFALGTPWRGAITVSGQPIDDVIQDLRNGYFRR